jgi:RHS repeat-associated protein
VGSKRTFRGNKTYLTEYLHSPACGRPISVAEAGQRSRSTIDTINASDYCQPAATRTYEGANLVAQSENLLTADRKNIASTTLYGPTRIGGLTHTFTYWPTGDIASTTDARGYRSHFYDYYRGTAQTELHPVASADASTESPATRITLSRSVDDLGRVASETDGEGRATSFTYNGRHKPTSITLPRVGSDQTINFTYGSTQDTITRGTRTETVNYDGFGRVTSASDGINTTTYRYDAAGRRVFVSYPSAGASSVGQSVEFDALNRPTKLIEPDPSNSATNVQTLIAYDDNSSSVTVTNPRGAVTTMTVEAFGDPANAWLVSRSSPEIGRMSFERNVFGQITNTSHGGIDRTMVYDAQQGYFLKQETHPELGTTTYGRDNNGNMTTKQVASSGVTSYAYDGQNRVATVTPPASPAGSPTLNNTWFKTGLVKTSNAGNITRSYVFDDSNNLTQETVSIDGTPRSLSYGYDTLDALASTTYPSGRVVSYAPDVIGRPTTASATSAPLISNATYWSSSMLKNLSFGNTVNQAFTEQSARPLVSGLTIQKGSNSAALNLGYQYDTVANLTGVTDSTNRGYARAVSYDLFDRLRTDNLEAITYTGVGDINTKAAANGAASTFAYDATTKRLQSITGNVNRSFGYDVYGNASADGRFNYQYDAFNSLRSVNGGLVAYDYDAHQHLAKKVSNAQTTHYLYGKNGRLFAEYNLATNASKEYVHLGNKLVGQIATSGTNSLVTGCGFNVDGVGPTNGEFTSDGLILARYARGLTGAALITGTRADQTPANLTTVINAINAHMSAYSSAHDIDASGGSISVNDAIITNRWIAGFRGNSLTQGLNLTGTRTNANDIQTYLASGCPYTPTTGGAVTTTFLHPNVTGSPIMATDANGDPAWFENYSAFGERLKNEPNANNGTASNQNWFIGKPVDTVTGLVYFGGRWYDPQVARFLGFDPAGVDEANPHSFNRYAYGNNNPYKYLDPDGRQVVQVAQALARAAAPVAGVADSVRAGQNPPAFDPATGIMSQPFDTSGGARLGGFLAAANTISLMFMPMAVMDRLAGIIQSVAGNNIANQNRDQLMSSKRSLENLIQEHQQKISDYLSNPYAHDNKGTLAAAKQEHKQSIIDGRVAALQKQITKQQENLQKVNDQLDTKND